MRDDVGAMVVESAALRAAGFRHGFSTRHGGVSDAPYDALNLGAAVGDDPERVRENHRRLAARVGYDAARLHQTSQVHGAAVWCPAEGADPEASRTVEADALVARGAGDAVAVRVADCVPVLLASTATGAVAAVHAGWRGVAQKIVGEALRALGEPAGALIAAVGPSIGPCCFEVDDAVAAQIADASAPEVVTKIEGTKPRVNLWRAVELQLRAAGVESVEVLGRCTRCEGAEFYSFRRDGQRSGRMVGVIVARPR